METTQITDSLGWIGSKLSEATQWIIVQLGNMSVNISPMGAKIINLILLAIILLAFVKLISMANKPLKWIIIILIVILLASTIFSFSL
jgi:hypothetical protein